MLDSLDPGNMGDMEIEVTPSEEMSTFNTPAWTPEMRHEGEEGYGGETGYDYQQGYDDGAGYDEQTGYGEQKGYGEEQPGHDV